METDFKAQRFVDLGLSSGTLWKDKNESGFFTYNQAMSRFWRNLPTKEELKELKSECKWSWTGSGCEVTGPNGKSIYLPAAGFRDSGNGNVYSVDSGGYFWSSTPDGSEIAWYLAFDLDGVFMCDGDRRDALSVHLVQEK